MRQLLPALIVILVMSATLSAQAQKPKRVMMLTDLEGVSGVFDIELQCEPYRSPRFEESRKLLTGEVNAAVQGLFEGGATEVVVRDGHDGGRTLSPLDIDPRVRLFLGYGWLPSMPVDSSYDAMIFIGQHPMAGAENGILSHTQTAEGVQNWWANGKAIGEIGTWVAVAGEVGVPTIMLSGDAVACQEFLDLVPNGECAAVKSGVSRTAGYMLPHAAATALIREKARRAMERLSEIKPYSIPGPVEIKVEYTTAGVKSHRPRADVIQLDPRTWVFRGRTFVEALLLVFSM